MIGSWAKKWLFPARIPKHTTRSSATAAETTGGGDEPVQWECVAAGLQPMEAHVIKSRLESESIVAILRQESIGSVMGLTVGALGAVSVWVPDSVAEQALNLLEDAQQ